MLSSTILSHGRETDTLSQDGALAKDEDVAIPIVALIEGYFEVPRDCWAQMKANSD